MNVLHGKLWMSKVLLEIIHTFLIFAGKIMRKELSKTRTIS